MEDFSNSVGGAGRGRQRVTGSELKALCMVGKRSTTDLHPQLFVWDGTFPDTTYYTQADLKLPTFLF